MARVHSATSAQYGEAMTTEPHHGVQESDPDVAGLEPIPGSQSPTSGTAFRTLAPNNKPLGHREGGEPDTVQDPSNRLSGRSQDVQGHAQARTSGRRSRLISVVPEPPLLPLNEGLDTWAGLPGRLADFVTSDTTLRGPGPIALVQPAAPAVPGEFPAGVVARCLDESRRLRPNLPGGQLTRLLGWQPGALGTTLVDGWIALVQRPEHVGARRSRSSHLAGFTAGASGCERIALRLAHLLHLDAVPGTLLMLAPVPDRGAVVIVNPLLIVRIAPTHICTLLGIDPDRHLTVVPEPVRNDEQGAI